MLVAIVQARIGSTRLPGKVIADVAGRPMLLQVVERVSRSKLICKVVVATSENAADDPIAALCRKEGISCFRGSEEDVLDRYYNAAKEHLADVVVRITADCPLIDPAVIDKVVSRFLENDFDYVSNTIRYTYPDGLDTEVFSFSALERAWAEAGKQSEREHVTPYIRTSGRFRVASVENDTNLSGSDYRWTVDEFEDLEFVRKVYTALSDKTFFGMREVLELIEQRPEIRQSNSGIIMNEGYYRTLYAQAKAGAAHPLKLDQSRYWLDRSRSVIPGCAQTFSKGSNQYVQGVSPVFLQKGKGCRVWDVDGNEYIDYVQGLLPNILGYANDEVNAAAAKQYGEGHSFSLPHPLEVQLAERLIDLIPCAEMARFAKNGSDATAGAVRSARAYTGRDRIACCGYHGWQDWFVGSTTRNAGVPGVVRELTHPFAYNDLASLEKLLNEHLGEFAAIIMEPVNFVEPGQGYLQSVKDIARKHGALLIFDEICSGFHFGLGGAQKRFGVTPDLACFGKAMGNGYPIACVVGRAEVMRVFEEIFFSFTFGGEVASIAAAMKVLDILEQTDVLARMEENGRRLQDGFNAMAKQARLSERFKCVGWPVWSLMKFLSAEGKDSFLERSLFQQESIKRGILFLATHNMTAAHDDLSTEQTLEAYASVFKTLAEWLSDKDPACHLEGAMIQPVFKVR